MNNREHALSAAEAGIHVYPGAPDKRPHLMLNGLAPKGQGGFNLATTDPAVIAQWWAEDPDAIVMWAPFKTGNFVADDDTVKKGTGPPPELPETPFVSNTRNRGTHHAYREAEGGRVPGTITDVVDIIHRGGVVLPTPGSGYEWRTALTDYAALLQAPRWPIDHPWPRGWRGRRERRRTTGEARVVVDREVEFDPSAIRHAELRKRFAREDVADRSAAAWSLMQECRGAGYRDELVVQIMSTYTPLLDKADENGGDWLDWWVEEHLARLNEVCPHEGRSCVRALCENASIWLMSDELTPGMKRIRDELIGIGGQVSKREAMRSVFGKRKVAVPTFARFIETTGVYRGYWLENTARFGVRGPETVVLTAGRRAGVRSDVDRETGEILGPSFSSPVAPTTRCEPTRISSSSTRDASSVLYRDPQKAREIRATGPKLGPRNRETGSSLLDAALCHACGSQTDDKAGASRVPCCAHHDHQHRQPTQEVA